MKYLDKTANLKFDFCHSYWTVNDVEFLVLQYEIYMP